MVRLETAAMGGEEGEAVGPASVPAATAAASGEVGEERAPAEAAATKDVPQASAAAPAQPAPPSECDGGGEEALLVDRFSDLTTAVTGAGQGAAAEPAGVEMIPIGGLGILAAVAEAVEAPAAPAAPAGATPVAPQGTSISGGSVSGAGRAQEVGLWSKTSRSYNVKNGRLPRMCS